MPAANPIATITNNLGYDVDIYDVFNPNAATQGLLTYTKLVTIPNGAASQQVQTIRFASQLQAMRTGNVSALNNNYYEQFPVAVLAVSPLSDPNTFTLTSDLQQAMEDSFKFIKYSQANPTSSMATAFRTALGDKTSQKNAVNAFFQSTVSFKNCTLSTWTAVMSWQAQFINPWQGTYYLYSLGTTDSGTTSSGASAPALVATLAITATADTNTAVLTMADSGGQDANVVMTGDGTMQEENPGTGNLSITLSPTWINITQTSKADGKTVTTYVIGAAYTGTINGTSVAGNLNQMAIPDPSDKSKNASDKNTANTFSLSTMISIVGMLTSIGMLYYMAKGHKAAEAQRQRDAEGRARNREEADEQEAEIEQDFQDVDVPQVREQSEVLEAEIVPQVGDGYAAVGQAEVVQSRLSMVQEQSGQIRDLLESGAANDIIEESAMNVEQARSDTMSAADPSISMADRDLFLTEVTTNLTNTSSSIEAQLADRGAEISQEEADVLSRAKEAMTDSNEQQESREQAERDQQDEIDNDGDREVNEDQFEDPEPEVPEPFVEGV